MNNFFPHSHSLIQERLLHQLQYTRLLLMLLLNDLLLLRHHLLMQTLGQIQLLTQPLDLFYGVRNRWVDEWADGVGETGEGDAEGRGEGEDLSLDVCGCAGCAGGGVLSGCGGGSGCLLWWMRVSGG